jgi:hypothetical protein
VQPIKPTHFARSAASEANIPVRLIHLYMAPLRLMRPDWADPLREAR